MKKTIYLYYNKFKSMYVCSSLCQNLLCVTYAVKLNYHRYMVQYFYWDKILAITSIKETRVFVVIILENFLDVCKIFPFVPSFFLLYYKLTQIFCWRKCFELFSILRGNFKTQNFSIELSV